MLIASSAAFWATIATGIAGFGVVAYGLAKTPIGATAKATIVIIYWAIIVAIAATIR